MRHVRLSALILLLVSGCEPHIVAVTPVDVKVPIPVSCVHDVIAEPVWNIPQLKQNATAPEKLKAALADLELSQGYIGELKAELEACG